LKTLHLLRHAKAGGGNPGGTDHARPLEERGVNDAKAMALYLQQQNLSVDRVYSSSSRRTRETYDLVAPGLGKAPATFRDELYLIDTSDLIEFVQSLPDNANSVMLIGHNPTYYVGATTLLRDAAPGQVEAFKALKEKFSTGALVSMTFPVDHWRDVHGASGTLTGYVRPKDIGAGKKD
jgi:phosphohistidine phosphatase